MAGMDRQIPLTPHSRALMEHRDELLAVARNSGLTNVRVFGSMARGDADENSDVDFSWGSHQATRRNWRRST